MNLKTDIRYFVKHLVVMKEVISHSPHQVTFVAIYSLPTLNLNLTSFLTRD